jgi:hypothetical protein
MKTHRWAVACIACGLGVSTAHADVKLQNKDSKAHDVIIKCNSTVQSSIQSNTTRSLGKGPCKVTLKGSGIELSGSGSDTIVIPKSKK